MTAPLVGFGTPTANLGDTTNVRCFLAFLSYYGTATPSAPTDDYGNTWTLVTAQNVSGSPALKTALYICDNPTVGNNGGSGHSFTCPSTGSTSSRAIEVVGEYDTEVAPMWGTTAGTAMNGSQGTATTRSTGAVVALEPDCRTYAFLAVNATPSGVTGGFTAIDTQAFSGGVNYGQMVARLEAYGSVDPQFSWGGSSVVGAAAIVTLFPRTSVNLLDDLGPYYEMEGSSGTNENDANGTNDGVQTSGTIGSAAGAVGNARDFPAGGYFATTNTITYTSSKVAVSFWINPDQTTTEKIVLESSTNFNSFDAAFVITHSNGGGGNIFAAIQDGVSGGARYLTKKTGTVLTTGVWTHVIIEFDNSTTAGQLRIFVDGVEVATTTPNNTKDQSGVFSTQKLYVGARSGNTLPFDGKLDEVGVWNRHFTHSERLALYNGGAGEVYANFTSSGGGGTEEVDITLALTQAVTIAAVKDAASSLGLSESLAGSFSGLESAACSAAAAIAQACDAAGGQDSDAAVELADERDIALAGSIGLAVDVELSHAEAAAMAALHVAGGGISLEGGLAVVIAADALRLADVPLDWLAGVTVNGSQADLVLDVPACRSVRVRVQVRTVEVPVQRVTVEWQNRRGEAGCCG